MTISRRRMTQLAMASVAMPTGLAFAQDDAAAIAFASGIGSPATTYDDLGNIVGTLTVTDLVTDWDGYGNYTPDEGRSYLLVTMEHTNLTDQEIILTPDNYFLYDNFGRRVSSSWLQSNDVEIFEEEMPLAAGATAVTHRAHQILDGASPMMSVYVGGWGLRTHIAFEQSDTGESSFARGIGAPATVYDSEGNTTSTLTVTDVVTQWDGYAQSEPPEEGTSYTLFTMEFANLSDQEITLDPTKFSRFDSYGRSAAEGRVRTEAVDLINSYLPVGAGDTVVINTVGVILDGTSHMMLMYQPNYEQTTLLYVGE